LAQTEEGRMTDGDHSISPGPGLKGIIFDMDGTLVSTLPLIVHCVSEISEQYLDKKLTLDQVIETFGPPAREIIRRLTSPLGETESKSAVKDYYDCYRSELPRKALLFPGIPDLLQALNGSGKQLAVFTGVERVLMDLTLDNFNLKQYFQVLVAGDDIVRPKPDPEGVRLAVGKLNLQPDQSIMIGDSPNDINSGKQAGVLTAAALWSPEGRGDPTTAEPDYTFRSVRELSSFLVPTQKKEEPGFYFAEDIR
jgi:pyrophosphatase PpaX